MTFGEFYGGAYYDRIVARVAVKVGTTEEKVRNIVRIVMEAQAEDVTPIDPCPPKGL